MKNIQEPIQITSLGPGGGFHWRDRAYAFNEVLERWFYRGKWWLDPSLRGESRHYYRVACHLQGAQPRQSIRQIGPYSDSVRQRKDPPSVSAVELKIFEIYRRCQADSSTEWILSRVVD